jgi:hypothetical protein
MDDIPWPGFGIGVAALGRAWDKDVAFVLRLAVIQETVSKLGVLCGTTLLAARRLGESNVVLFECSVHNGRPHLEHEVCSSR